jgi:hypothetical protein
MATSNVIDDLIKEYLQKGATTRRDVMEGEEMKSYYDPTDLGGGWNAWEKPGKQIGMQGQGEDVTPIYEQPGLGGFSRKEGDFVNFYDTEGQLVHRQKWNENDLKSIWGDLGPLAMAALTAGGGAGVLGNSLFGLQGAAAAGAGGALAGGVNAGLTGRNILTGALRGGLGGAGALKLGNILGTDVTVGDVSKAVNFAQNPTLNNLFGAASKYLPSDISLGNTGISVNDIMKGVNAAQAFTSGDHRRMFDAATGMAGGPSSSAVQSTSSTQSAAPQNEAAADNAFKPTQSAAIPVQSDTGPIQLMQDIFGTDIASAQKTGARGYGFSGGGDIDELLRILRS